MDLLAAPSRLARDSRYDYVRDLTIMRNIQIYFDYVSPFPYFLSEFILKNDIERRYALSLEWTPVFLGGLHPDNNHTPYNATDPRRMAYSAFETKRYAEELHVPYVGTLFRPIPVLRAGIAAKRQGRFAAFHVELYRRIQGQGRTPDDALLTDTIRSVGGDGDLLLSAMQSPDVKRELIDNAEAAKKHGVFGVPFVLDGDQPYWGYSHFPYLLRELDNAK